MRQPSDNDRRVHAEVKRHGGTLAEAVAAVALSNGYKPSAVYGIRHRVDLWDKQHAAPQPILPEGQVLKGVSSLVDGEGAISRQWIKTDAIKSNWQHLMSVALERVRHIEPIQLVSRPAPTTDRDEYTVYPVTDWHVGLASAVQAGWTLDKAAATYREAFGRLVQSKYPANSALLVFMGDFTHTDNQTNTTPRSGKPLDVTGDYSAIVETAMQLVVDVIDLAVASHARVTVVYLAGNHDEATAVVMQAALKRLYALHTQVKVETCGRFYYQVVGRTLLGFTHGHTVKREQLPMIMATDQPQLWGASVQRVWHTGHIHHKTLMESIGCIVESHAAPTPADKWHNDSGYRSRRSMTSITYDTTGEIARNTVNL